MEFYHGSGDRFDAINGAICLTEDFRAATEYALHKDGLYAEAGYVHTITVPDGLAIADEDELRAVASQVLGNLGVYSYVYELADHAQVRAALAAAGYAGVRYEDQTIDGTAHDCLLLWDVDGLVVTDVEVV